MSQTSKGSSTEPRAPLSEEFALQRNEPLLREAADSTPAPVWMTDSAGAVEFMNRAFSELTGIPQEQALGDAWLSVLHPDDLAAVREKRAAAWAAGHVAYTFEARFRRHDGAWRWFEVSSKPRIDAEGRFHGYVGLAVDRTDALAAQAALSESERRYRELVENQPDLICRFRRDGEIAFVNCAYAQALGTTVEALTGADFWNWIPETDRPAVEAMLNGLTLEAPEARVENRFRTVDGERWTLWTNRALAFDDEGRWTEAQSTGVDIHERRMAEEHNRLLLNELNHRVKNMLAVVQGIAQQTFKHVDAAAQRAFESRIGALSRAHSLLTDRQWSPAPLRAIIDDVSHVCGAARERIRTEGPDVMLASRQALSIAMAFHELCTNAVKYGALSNPRGVVDICWRVSDGGLLELVWTESGGPPVRTPKKRGYGSRMIEHALAHDLHGSVKLAFERGGLVCTIAAPLNA